MFSKAAHLVSLFKGTQGATSTLSRDDLLRYDFLSSSGCTGVCQWTKEIVAH